MTRLTIDLPDTLSEFVAAQVSEGGYESASEFVQAVLRDREEQEKQAAREWLHAELRKGIESGPATEWTEADWEEIERSVFGDSGRPQK